MSYRLSQQKKEAISRNLVDFMESDKELSRDAATFIGNWILTDVKEKTKAFFDVWDLVLEIICQPPILCFTDPANGEKMGKSEVLPDRFTAHKDSAKIKGFF